MSDKYQEYALKLAAKLEREHVGEIKGLVGLMDLVCRIVEETCKRNKKNKERLSPQFKRELAIMISSAVLDKLYEKGLIEEDIYKFISYNLTDDNIVYLGHTIDDVISIWNNNKKHIFKLLQLCGMKKKATLKKIK